MPTKKTPGDARGYLISSLRDDKNARYYYFPCQSPKARNFA
jgi:hypothetical protein